MIACGYRGGGFRVSAFDQGQNRELVPLTRPLRGRPLPTGERWGASIDAVGSNQNCGVPLSPRLSPAGRGRFRRSRKRVRGCCSHVGRNVWSIISSTPSKLSYTSEFDTRTTRQPNVSSARVRSVSCATATSVEWVAPSTSTISFPTSVTKSTTYRSIACWRRNFQLPSRRPRSARQSRASALVCEDRSWRALLSNRRIPLTRLLRGRPLLAGETCTTRGGSQ